ncbi:MAG: hypothetical protein HY320_13200 [Armatimonadetes bacterium]|nr:hypothetical protein [Armatimonadota bacterium]
MIRRITHWLIPMLAVVTLAGTPAHAQQTLDFYVQRNLRDLQSSAAVISKDDRELAKIGRDFVEAYNLQKREFFLKEPGCVRMQGKKGVVTVRFITNGNRKLTEVSSLHIHSVKDLTQAPDEGETALDFGLITPSVLEKMDGRFLRMEPRGGKNCAVFEMWFRAQPRPKHTVWLDPATKTVVDHIEHHRGRRRPGFKKRFAFSEVRQIGGVNVPARVDIYNGENQLAGSSRYENIRVNVGLDDKLFQF